MKLLKRLIYGFLLLLVALVIFLGGSVLVDFALGGDRLESLADSIIPGANGQPDVLAYVAKPEEDGPFPAVIMIHEFYGLNESIIGKAEGLAQEGYYVVAPDTFRGATTTWIPRAIYQVISTKQETVNADLDSVYAWLESQPDVDANRIAIAGFCYGGRASLLYSLHNNRLAATVVFYGSPETDPQVLKNLPGPVLGIFGGADQSISVEDVNAFEEGLQAADVPHEITIYDGQPHAFVTDIESIRAGGAQGEAWAQMLGFLDKNLKNGSSGPSEGGISYNATFPWRYYAMLVYEHAFGSANHHH
ncbi:MAG: dienelactone hydrolase family protein [Anaerolineales bacterium]|nr:dienelactone hydrolase family protein [Anaerolineales bacterium]